MNNNATCTSADNPPYHCDARLTQTGLRCYGPFPPLAPVDGLWAAMRALGAAKPLPPLTRSGSPAELLHDCFASRRLPAGSIVLTGPVISRSAADVFERLSLGCQPFYSNSSSSGAWYLRWDAPLRWEPRSAEAIASLAAAPVSTRRLVVIDADAAEVAAALRHDLEGRLACEHRMSLCGSAVSMSLASLLRVASLVIVRWEQHGFSTSIGLFQDAALFYHLQASCPTMHFRAKRVVATHYLRRTLALSVSDPLSFGIITRVFPEAAVIAVEQAARTVLDGTGFVTLTPASPLRAQVALEFITALVVHQARSRCGFFWRVRGCAQATDTLLPSGSVLLLLEVQNHAPESDALAEQRKLQSISLIHSLLERLKAHGFRFQLPAASLSFSEATAPPHVFVDSRLCEALHSRGLLLPLHEGLGGAARLTLLRLLLEAVEIKMCEGPAGSTWGLKDAPCSWAWIAGGPLLGFAASKL
jgi:hypothetical protein